MLYAAGRGSVAWSTESEQSNAPTRTSPPTGQSNWGAQRSAAELERLLAAAQEKLAEVPPLHIVVVAYALYSAFRDI